MCFCYHAVTFGLGVIDRTRLGEEVRRISCRPQISKGSLLASRIEMSAFLASVERRAFKQALFAVRDEDHALDVVQDSMLKLSEKYGDKPPSELPMLFQRILQNTIRDFYRRQKVRSMWVTLWSALSPKIGRAHV